MSDTLMEHAYAKLRNKLETGELLPGTRLVNRTLGKELGVSTVTLREAIHRLSSEGIVEHIPNAGAFVRKLNRREVTELYELRNVLEVFAIEKAFANIDEQQLIRLQEICEEFHEATRSIRDNPRGVLDAEAHRRWIAFDMEFHRILVDAADNQSLKKVIVDLRLMSRIARTKPTEIDLGYAASTYRMHAGIVRGLRRRNLEEARYWMSRHNVVALANARRLVSETN